MKVSVILGHPYEKSFNSAIAEVVVQQLESMGHTVYFHDLQKENFKPVLNAPELISDYNDDLLVQLCQKEIVDSDGIVIIHPNWWGQPPAIMKGWIDRVLRENIAYKFEDGDNGGGLPIGLLHAQKAIVFNTSNTDKTREENVFGDPLEAIWKDCIFDFCGVSDFQRRMFRIIADSSEKDRLIWLNEVKDIIATSF